MYGLGQLGNEIGPMIEIIGWHKKRAQNALDEMIQPVLTGFSYQPANSFAGALAGSLRH
jgi:hypothetical protein